MHVHDLSLTSAARYLEAEGHRPLEVYEPEYRKFVGRAARGRPVGPGTRILEVGIGTGWLLILCARHGLDAVGLDASPQLIEFVHRRAARHGVTLDLRLGKVEDAPLEPGSFDVVVADSVFEHVERWREGLARVALALRPGGVLIFSSTNRFALRSGEFTRLPCYGWLPDRARYALRRAVEGPDVMRFGIDFHQFTYPVLRRALAGAGFSRVHDVVDLLDPDRLNHPSPWKSALLRAMRRSRLVRRAALTFWPATELVAVK
jgi:SAM-dependent methyltransferase